jgi:hypothetical protein
MIILQDTIEDSELEEGDLEEGDEEAEEADKADKANRTANETNQAETNQAAEYSGIVLHPYQNQTVYTNMCIP